MSDTIKKVIFIAIVLGGVIAFFIFIKDVRGLLNKGAWTVHNIGDLEFESPYKMNPISFEGSAADELTRVILYTDENVEHPTCCLVADVKDSLSIVDAYSAALETILVRHQIDPAILQMDDINVDEREMSSTFSYKLNGVPALGYGFLKLTDNKIESLWLVPVTKGFSDDYIEQFKKGIRSRSIPNSEQE